MTDEIVATLSVAREDESRAKKFFRIIGREDLANLPLEEYGYTFQWSSAEDLNGFLSTWESVGGDRSDLFITWDRRYTETELRQAPLLRLVVTRPERGMGGPRYGTRFDMTSACWHCGSGARQVSPLVVNPGEVERSGDVSQTLDREILVSPRVAAALASVGVGVDELRPVETVGRPLPQTWVQLLAQETLPPMSPRSEGFVREDPCPVCLRDGFFSTAAQPETIRYEISAEQLERLRPVMCTYERFGNSLLAETLPDSHFAAPLTIVQPEVFTCLKKLGVRGVEFIPVSLLT